MPIIIPLIRWKNEYYMDQINQTLDLIHSAIHDKRKDALFYKYLYELTPHKEDKTILETIRKNKNRHHHYFKEIYHAMTGRMPTIEKPLRVEKPKSYRDGLLSGYYNELASIQDHRTVMHSMPNQLHKTLLFEIMTDQMIHALHLVFLLSMEQSRFKQEPNDKPI